MNFKKELAFWFTEKQNYEKGIEIFTNLIGDTPRVKFFNSGKSNIHINLLKKALLRFAQINKITPLKRNIHIKEPGGTKIKPGPGTKNKHVISKGTKNHIHVVKRNVNYDDLPIHLQNKYDQNGALYAQIRTLHAKMSALNAAPINDIKRKGYLTQILIYRVTMSQNWSDIDEMDKITEQQKPTGKLTLSEINSIEDVTIKALSTQKRIIANIMYIRRYADSKQPLQQTEIQLRIDELKELNIDYETRIKPKIKQATDK